MGRRKTLILSVAVLLCILIYWGFYNGLVVRKYIVESRKLNDGESIRIVLITDLHSHIYGENQREIVSIIERQKPDIIALGGDIADDIVPIKGTELLLEGIKTLAPIFYVSGNHEFWTGDISSVKSSIREQGAVILESEYREIKIRSAELIIGGVDDPDIVHYEKPDYNWLGKMNSSFIRLKDAPIYKILLAHRPELIEMYKENNFDLVLSGHAHGGQVRIPLLLNGLYAPNQGWFPKYAGGIYKHGVTTHIVSRGVSYNPRLPRIFNPPEIVVIDIKGIADK